MCASFRSLREIHFSISEGCEGHVGQGFIHSWRIHRQKGLLCRFLADAVKHPKGIRQEETRFWDKVEEFSRHAEAELEWHEVRPLLDWSRLVAPRNPVPEEGTPEAMEELEEKSLLPTRLFVRTARALSLREQTPVDIRSKEDLATPVIEGVVVPDRLRSFRTILWNTLAESPVIGRAIVPVALDDQEKDEGEICRLCLEIFAGPPGVAVHPEQFATGFDSTRLTRSMEYSWQAANELVFGNPGDQFCGRWQLWGRDSESAPFQAAGGDSLGGAAARGWVCALTQAAKQFGKPVQTPLLADPRLLVIAQVNIDADHKFILAPVDDGGVQKKVRKLCEIVKGGIDARVEISIDRIAVVDPDKKGNWRTAQLVIADAKLGEWLDAVDIATYTPPAVETNAAAAGSP